MKSITEITKIIANGIASAIQRQGTEQEWVITTDRNFVNDFMQSAHGEPVPDDRTPEFMRVDSVDSSTVGYYYTLNDNGAFEQVYLDGTNFNPNEVYYSLIDDVDDDRVKDYADLEDIDDTDGPSDNEQKDIDNTVFAVIKVGRGDVVRLLYSCPISIQILSNNGDLENIRAVLLDFINSVNFMYLDGVVQSYFMPEVSNSMSEVYQGFRALFIVSGEIKVPVSEDLLFVTGFSVYDDSLMSVVGQEVYSFNNIEALQTDSRRVGFFSKMVPQNPISLAERYIKVGDELYLKGCFSNEFWLNVNFADTKSPDPVSFSGDISATTGDTLTLNKQTTKTVSVSTYLMSTTPLGKLAIESLSTLNKKTKICVRTPIVVRKTDENGNPLYWNGSSAITQKTGNPIYILNENDSGNFLELAGGWWVVTSVSNTAKFGDIDPFIISFAKARENN